MVIDPDFVAQHWPLSSVRVGQSLHSYPTRSVRVVHSDEGTYVAKVVPVPHDEPEADRPPSVLEYLSERGYEHSPALLRTRSGDQLVQSGTHTICMLEYVPEDFPEAGHDHPSAWHDLGRAAARLNSYVDCPFRYAVPTNAALVDITQWMHGRPFEKEFLALRPRLDELLNPEGEGLIHGEINPANARRRADGTVVLLDWDEAGTGSIGLELGYPLITVFISEADLSFHRDSAQAFYRGYVDSGGTADREIVFNAGLFHAIRYMRFGDIDRRWRRIGYALDHECELCSTIP